MLTILTKLLLALTPTILNTTLLTCAYQGVGALPLQEILEHRVEGFPLLVLNTTLDTLLLPLALHTAIVRHRTIWLLHHLLLIEHRNYKL